MDTRWYTLLLELRAGGATRAADQIEGIHLARRWRDDDPNGDTAPDASQSNRADHDCPPRSRPPEFHPCPQGDVDGGGPATQLLTSAPRDRALVEQWMDWQATELNDAWRTAFPALHRGVPAPAAAIRESTSRWNQKMRMLDEQLARTGAHVAGEHFTVADVVLGLSSHRWKATPIDHFDLPAVQAYLLRLKAQPGFAEFVDNGMP